jgi:signal transduction histidine kinase/CheY-like chemotaxis protein
MTNALPDDPHVDDADWVRREELVAFAGYPLLVEGRVVGVAAMFARQPLAPSALVGLASVADEIAQYVARKRAEATLAERETLLQQIQKMEAVGRLAGGIAHDFNNLLTVIRGRAAILLHRLAPEDPAHRHITLIEKTAERAAALTQQLLSFTRKRPLEPRVVSLNDVVVGIEKMLRRLIGEHIHLVTVLDPGLGHTKADPIQIEQVILNMVVNARDAMPQGGRLTIETANVELDEAYAATHPGARPGRYVGLAVADTGTGMDEETRARVFEPFFTTKDPGRGTGLGLATVYGIVKQSAGYVWVESAPGRGARFTVYLPRETGSPASETPPAEARRPPATGSETVLLVEDEAGVRDLAREVLESHGYRVLIARDPGEALLMGERHPGPIDVVVTDVVMPLMNGRELGVRLMSMRPDLRLVYMSGQQVDPLVDEALLRSTGPLLTKPFAPGALAGAVRQVLDAARGPDPR